MMLENNKYSKWYFSIIENAKNKNYTIYEKHHILPKSLGGSNDKDNLVNLSLREHYICHKLLTKMTKGGMKHKMLYALHKMCFSGKYGNGSRLYEIFRKEFIHSLKEFHPSKTNNDYGDKRSKITAKSWTNADDRRKKHAKDMKEKWKNGTFTKEMSRKNGQHGLSGKEIHNTLDIEYRGVIYYGWSELLEKTKVSKHLYKKYYLNGLDPEPRIGTDGPIPTITSTINTKEGSV
jgi:hypothetical protein